MVKEDRLFHLQLEGDNNRLGEFITRLESCRIEFIQQLDKVDTQATGFDIWEIIRKRRLFVYEVRAILMAIVSGDDRRSAAAAEDILDNHPFADATAVVCQPAEPPVMPRSPPASLIIDGPSLQVADFSNHGSADL